MGKILLAIDELNPDMNAIDFSCYLAKLMDSELVGIFLRDPHKEKIHMRDKIYTVEPDKLLSDEAKRRHYEETANSFKNTCEQRGVAYKIHVDRGTPLEEVVMESRFADLLIVESGTSFADHKE